MASSTNAYTYRPVKGQQGTYTVHANGVQVATVYRMALVGGTAPAKAQQWQATATHTGARTPAGTGYPTRTKAVHAVLAMPAPTPAAPAAPSFSPATLAKAGVSTPASQRPAAVAALAARNHGTAPQPPQGPAAAHTWRHGTCVAHPRCTGLYVPAVAAPGTLWQPAPAPRKRPAVWRVAKAVAGWVVAQHTPYRTAH